MNKKTMSLTSQVLIVTEVSVGMIWPSIVQESVIQFLCFAQRTSCIKIEQQAFLYVVI